ncbi:MAG: DUF58 domain-containing protein [Candidatus Thermoplasmatota archaeon]|nr:DUF58 domain-containing protein [Candidatus Thermoplasmatota archaeon]MBS3790439.1 DUF58 domain-containing protein [Candidatus Thermoplasmatota archaeon]
MAEVQLSIRGKILFVLPIFLVATSIFTREPYVVVTAVFLFSVVFYSRFEVTNCSVEIEDDISEGNKTVGESFKVKHKFRSERNLELRISNVLKGEFELSGKEDFKEKIQTNSQISYRVNPKSRGFHKLGKITGWLYDPLKIYKKSIEHEIELEIMVQSSKEAIKKAKTYSKRSYAEKYVEDPLAFTVRSNEFEGIREFQPGDSLRDIHWKSFSKFQKLMTRVYEKVSPIGTQILLDCSPSMRRKLSDGTTKLDHSIYITLQILKNFDILGHDIGMTAYDHKDIIFHQSPDSGTAAFRRLYEKVTELPGAIDSKNISIERYQGSLNLDDLDVEEKRFAEKVGELTSISTRAHLAGVLSSVDQMRARGEKRKLVVIISDLEMQPQAALKAVEYLKKMKNEVWIIVPFSPWYEVEEVDEEILEKTYREYEKLENILGNMERLGCPIFELYPDKEGITILEEWGERKT